MSKYQSTTHVTYNIGYHVVFSPKYRYNLLRYRAAERLKEQLSENAAEHRPRTERLHLLPPPGGDYLRRYPSLWTRSYFVESVGNISKKTVVHYIENQMTRALSSPS